MRRHAAAALGTIAAVGGACFAWGLLEAKLFTVRTATARILPEGAEPIRVLHISDIHLIKGQAHKERFLRSLVQLQPSLVINTGDNITSAAAVAPLLDALAPLGGIPGVFVFGSNDYYPPSFKNPLTYLAQGRSRMGHELPQELPWQDLRDGFEALGWVDLSGHTATMEVNGQKFAFRGTDDAHLERDDYSIVAGPADPGAINIGVTHAPYLRLLDAMTADGVDMIFAGHTHGGQVCIPGYGALITNCDLDPARVKGLTGHSYGANRAMLHVSGGLGTSPFAPYRFSNRPEVTLLELLPQR